MDEYELDRPAFDEFTVVAVRVTAPTCAITVVVDGETRDFCVRMEQAGGIDLMVSDASSPDASLERWMWSKGMLWAPQRIAALLRATLSGASVELPMTIAYASTGSRRDVSSL